MEKEPWKFPALLAKGRMGRNTPSRGPRGDQEQSHSSGCSLSPGAGHCSNSNFIVLGHSTGSLSCTSLTLISLTTCGLFSSFHYEWDTSSSSMNDPMVDSGKASDISVSSWPMEPIQWGPFPLLHQLSRQRPVSQGRGEGLQGPGWVCRGCVHPSLGG